MQFDFQLADIGDHVQVIAGPFNVGVNPWSGTGFHEFDGIVDGAPGDAGVNGGLNQLRDGALGVGFSLIFQLSTTRSASTRTLLSKIVPLAVVHDRNRTSHRRCAAPAYRDARRPALACHRH